MSSLHATRGLPPAAAAAVLAVAGCSSAPPPRPALESPILAVEVRHFAGSPLSGPLPAGTSPGASTSAGRPEDALRVAFAVFYLDALPEGLLESGGAAARLVFAAGSGDPIRSAPRLSGVRMGAVVDATVLENELVEGRHGRCTRVLSARAALPAGVTASLRLAKPTGLTGSGRATAVEIHRPHAGPAGSTGALVLALELEGSRLLGPRQSPGLGSGDTVGEETGDAATAGALRRELVLMVLTGGSPLADSAVFFPSPAADAQGATIGVCIDVEPPPVPPAVVSAAVAAEHAEALASCIADLGAAPRGDVVATVDSGPPPPAAYDWARALAVLAFPSRQRRALVYLAETADARLALDVALSASDEHLAQVCAGVLESPEKRAGTAASAAPFDPAARAWLLNRATLAVLSRLVAAKALPPELDAVLARHLGEAGRQPSSLEALLEGARSRSDLEALSERENFILLEDGSPSARVRAHEWLGQRGSAPAGFDPLAPARERRAALERALNVSGRASATQGKESR